MVITGLTRRREARPLETLSSSTTFFYKFFVPVFWSVGFGVGTFSMLLSGKPELRVMDTMYAVVWLGGSAALWWVCARLKRVQLYDGTLVISNYRDEIRVPAREIETVRQNLFINPKIVTVTFRSDTPFGRSIIFAPPISFSMFAESECVRRLRELTGPARPD